MLTTSLLVACKCVIEAYNETIKRYNVIAQFLFRFWSVGTVLTGINATTNCPYNFIMQLQ